MEEQYRNPERCGGSGILSAVIAIPNRPVGGPSKKASEEGVSECL